MARKRHLHPAQGVYLGFCLSQLTQHKVLPSFCLSQMTQHRGIPAFVFSADRAVLLSFPCGPEVLVPTGIGRGPQSISRTRLRIYTRTRALNTFYIGKKWCKLYTVACKPLVLKHTRVYSWPPKLYTNCSPTLHKTCRRHGPNSPLPRHRKRARRKDCRTGVSRNVNAKSTDLVFGKKCIIFALLRSGLAANARLLRRFFVRYGPPKSLEGPLAGSTW